MFKKLASNIKKAFDAPTPKARDIYELDSIYKDPDLYNHILTLMNQPAESKSRVEVDILNGYLWNKDLIDAYHFQSQMASAGVNVHGNARAAAG